MAVTNYYEPYESIEQNVNAASASAESNSAASLASEIEEYSSTLGQIDLTNWNDEAGNSIKTIIGEIIQDLNNTATIVSSVKGKSDALYIKLKKDLSDLKFTNDKYKSSCEKYINPDNYENGTEDYRYKRELRIKERDMSTYKIGCEKYVAEIEKTISDLGKINASDLSAESLAEIAGITVNSTFNYTYGDYEFTEEESFRMYELLSVLDFSLLGYSDEEIMKMFYENKDNENFWLNIHDTVQYIPSNFNEIIRYTYQEPPLTFDQLKENGAVPGALSGKTGEFNPYDFSAYRDENNPDHAQEACSYYPTVVNIGGVDIEFLVKARPGTHDNPLEFANLFIDEANGINQITHYPPDQLQFVTSGPDDNYWYAEKQHATICYSNANPNCGGYFKAGTCDIVINSECGRDYALNTLNHELGHKMDWVVESGDFSYTGEKSDSWKDLLDENIGPMEEILNPGFERGEGNDRNNVTHMRECMAEINKYYQRYPEEMKMTCPDLYAAYDAWVNPGGSERGTMPITIGGNPISSDSLTDQMLYTSGQLIDLPPDFVAIQPIEELPLACPTDLGPL